MYTMALRYHLNNVVLLYGGALRTNICKDQHDKIEP